jgi:hypothetical protein
MQTASAVSNGTWRVGAQLSSALYCGSFTAGPLTCTEYPDGAPLPELRVNARRGLPHDQDVGLSLQLAGQLFAPNRPIEAGLTGEWKAELLSGRVGATHQVLSLGLLAAGAVAGRVGLPPDLQGELGLNLLYGIQTRRYEWVLGASLSERSLSYEVGGHPALSSQRTERLGFSVGVFRRSPAGWALQLGYLGDPSRYDRGAIQLQYGLFWDLAPH